MPPQSVDLVDCSASNFADSAPGVEHPQDEVKDAIIAQFARGTALGHREVRPDPGGERRCGELDGNWRRYRLWGWGAHSAMASCEG